MADLWNTFLASVRSAIGDHTFDTWFSSVRCGGFSDHCLSIEVPDDFFEKWIKDFYTPAITAALQKIDPIAVFSISVNPELRKKQEKKPINKQTVAAVNAVFANEPEHSVKLTDRYIFENFIVGDSNFFAYASAKKIAEEPGKFGNPFFVYGKTGLGKTHLIQAIAHEILLKNKHTKICYISAQTFTEELINAIRVTQKPGVFREKYLNCDVLIIDDIQFIAGKEATQQEIFGIFNILFENHKQIILTSDRQPRDINRLEERLVTRFCCGLTVDIQPPDYETRVAILKKKIEKEPIKVSDDIIDFIALNITNSVRELEGALLRVVSFSLLGNKPLSLEIVKSVLKEMIHEAPLKIDADIIIEKVATFFSLTKQDIKSTKRSKTIVTAKQIAIFLCRELTEFSFPELGSFFGGKHHTTIMYSYQKVKDLLLKDETTKEAVLKIKQSLLR